MHRPENLVKCAHNETNLFLRLGAPAWDILFAEGLNPVCCEPTCAGTDPSGSTPGTSSPHPWLHGPYTRNNEAVVEVRHSSEGKQMQEKKVSERQAAGRK